MRLEFLHNGHVWAFLFLLSVAPGGCAFNIAPAYNALVVNVEPDSRPGYIADRGKQQQLYSAKAIVYYYLFFWPITPAEESITGEYLFNHRLGCWDLWQFTNLKTMPSSRSGEALRELAQGIAPPPEGYYSSRRPLPVHWILSINPFVLAIGTDTHAPDLKDISSSIISSGVPIDYTIPGANDLDRTATELLVLDKFPPPWEGSGTDWEKQFAADLAGHARKVSLPRPMTLKEIMKQHPW